MENQNMLPAEVAQIAQNVSVEKRNEVQTVLNQVFDGVTKMREQLDVVSVVDENDSVNMKLANTIRLGVKKVRLDAEKVFDAKREEVQTKMLGFKTEDSLWLKAKQTMIILTKEIEDLAKYKEETKQRIEAERKELKVQERIAKLAKFDSQVPRYEFENMSDEMFEMFFAGIEKAFKDKIEAEKKAEIERLEAIKKESEEREKQRLENERLKAENEAKEKQLKEERAKAEKERKALEEKQRIENEAKEKAIEIERKKQVEIQAKKDAEIQIEKDKLKFIEDEKQAEIKRQQAIELEAKKHADKLAKSSDKVKLTVWVDSFEFSSSDCTGISNESKVVYDDIALKFENFKKWAKEQVNKI